MSKPQRGVAVGASAALAVSLGVLGGLVFLGPLGGTSASLFGRIQLLAICTLGPAVMFVVSVGRVANHRFSTPDDINGSGLTAGTARAKLLQALLQNTLEQLSLALPAYAVWAVLAPARLVAVLPGAAALFVLGRLLFFWGYARGAAGRAMGFGLTFYPTVLVLAGCVVMAVGLAGS